MAKIEYYVMDTETTTYDDTDPASIQDYIEHMGSLENVKAYSVAFCNINATTFKDVYVRPKIEDFLNFFMCLQERAEIYIHNAKFDIEFILPTLFNNKWHYSNVPDTFLQLGEFKITRNNLGVTYNLKFKNLHNKVISIYDSYKLLPQSLETITNDFNTPHKKTTMDYFNKYSLADLSKKDIEYIKNDCLGLAEAIKSLKAIGCIKHTASASSLYEFKEHLNTKLKLSKDTQKKLKEENGGTYKDTGLFYYFPKLSRVPFPESLLSPRCLKMLDNANDGEKLDANVCIAAYAHYRGGWTYCCEHIKNTFLDNIIGYTCDYTSMYPSMATQPTDNGNKRYIPYGLPKEIITNFTGRWDSINNRLLNVKSSNVVLLAVKCKFYIKPNKLPCINIKDNLNYGSREWLKHSIKDDTPTLYTISGGGIEGSEWELIKENYYLYDVEPVYAIVFDGIENNEVFGDFYNEWIKIKDKAGKDGQKALRAYAKLIMNGLTGKFAARIVLKSQYPVWEPEVDKDGKPIIDDVQQEVMDDDLKLCGYVKKKIQRGKVIWKTQEQRLSKNTECYVPVTAQLTAFARCQIIRDAQKYYNDDPALNHYFYTDTDSISHDGDPQLIKIGTGLGTYKVESEFTGAVFIGAKCYAKRIVKENNKPVTLKHTVIDPVTNTKHKEDYLVNGKPIPYNIEVKVAGLPEESREKFILDNLDKFFNVFGTGLVIKNAKTTVKRLVGGVMLGTTDFTIKERKRGIF